MIESERKMLLELEAAGYSYTGINHIYKVTLPPVVAEIILKWLPFIYKDHVGSGEHLIRSLISTEKPFNPSVIIDLFENSNYNSSLKWTMAYVLAIGKTPDISDWLRKQLLNEESSFERCGFLDGLEKKAGIKDRQELMHVLKCLFEKYWYFEHFQKLFQKYAGLKDLPFLEEKLRNPDLTIFLKYIANADLNFGGNRLKNADKRFVREITKVIEVVRNRKREYSFPPKSKN